MKKAVINILSILAFIFLLWICISFVEVILKNGNTNPQYMTINFFNLLKGIL